MEKKEKIVGIVGSLPAICHAGNVPEQKNLISRTKFHTGPPESAGRDCREGAIGNENGQIRPAKADNIASTEATVSVGGHLMLG